MRMKFGGQFSNKLLGLFRQFTTAPNLQVIKIDMDKINPKVCLEPLLASSTPIEELVLHNVIWD